MSKFALTGADIFTSTVGGAFVALALLILAADSSELAADTSERIFLSIMLLHGLYLLCLRLVVRALTRSSTRYLISRTEVQIYHRSRLAHRVAPDAFFDGRVVSQRRNRGTIVPGDLLWRDLWLVDAGLSWFSRLYHIDDLALVQIRDPEEVLRILRSAAT